jgi:hypothetical protein
MMAAKVMASPPFVSFSSASDNGLNSINGKSPFTYC